MDAEERRTGRLRRKDCAENCLLNEHGQCQEHGIMRRMMFSLIGTGAALFVVLVAMWSSMASTQSEIATTLASTVATQAAVTQSVIGLKADLKDGLCRLTDDIRDVRKAIDVRDIDKRRYQ